MTAVVLGSMAAATVTAVAVAIGLAVRRRPSIGTVTMGPGGWLSLKNSSSPRLRAAPPAHRPWWARALHAHRLIVQH